MAQADGQVLIDTKIDTDGMEKGFERLIKSIDRIGDHVEKIGKQLDSAFSPKQAVENIGEVSAAAKSAGNNISAAFSGANFEKPLNKALENARHKVEALEQELAETSNLLASGKAEGKTPTNNKAMAALSANQSALYEKLAESRRKLEMEVAAAAQREAKAEEKAAEKAAKAAEKKAAAEERAQKKRMKEAFKGLDRAKLRMSEIALGSIIYNTLGQAILSMTKYVGAALKSNDQFSASFARVKGALLTAFQPIYEVVLPALISLMNVLSAVITVIGRFFAALAGKNYSQMQKNAEALHAQAGGIGAVGAAAKKAKRELAGFDEINKLSFPDTSGGGGGGAGIGEIGADFSEPEDIANLNQILYLVGAISAALLGWKIAKLFTDDLSTVAGVSMAIGGAFLMATNWADAFANGLDWDNLSGMMVGLAVAVGGLALAFGATGAAVGLLIGGVALVVLAVKEWIETGELGEEACVALTVGITAIGVAISLVTKGPIPAIIAAIAAFAIACVTNGDKVKGAFNKVLDWIKGFFLRDWREVFGNTLGSILNFFSEKVVGFVEKQINALKGLIDFVQGVFTENWKQAWQGICDFVKNLVPDALKKAFNKVVELWNKVASKISAALKFEIKPLKIGDTQIFGGGKVTLGKVPSIPYLAKGAVIPPNAPFLAMLGDQKRGTNIEAPLSTIEDAVERVMSRHGNTSDERIIVLLSQILEAVLGIEIDGATLSKAIDNYRRKEAVMRGG